MEKKKIIAHTLYLYKSFILSLKGLLLTLLGGVRKSLSVAVLLLLSSSAALAHSRFQTVKFPLHADTEQRAHIDSTMRAQPGVFSAVWSPRRQMIVVVYDRTITNKRQLRRDVAVICQHKDKKPQDGAIDKSFGFSFITRTRKTSLVPR